jgi:hypothetical protein
VPFPAADKLKTNVEEALALLKDETGKDRSDW